MNSTAMKGIVFTALLSMAGLAYGADSALYLGGGIGSTSLDTKGYDTASSYKVAAGVQSEGFALELGYVDLGTFDPKSAGSSVGINGVQVNALGELFLSKDIYGYGSFGLYNWNQKAGGSDSGTTVTYGLGLKVQMHKVFAVRGGIERFHDIAGSAADLVSLNGIFYFR